MYIIIWRNSHRDPHVDVDSHEFINSFHSEESAREYAEQMVTNQGPRDPHFFDFKIYQETE